MKSLCLPNPLGTLFFFSERGLSKSAVTTGVWEDVEIEANIEEGQTILNCALYLPRAFHAVLVSVAAYHKLSSLKQ